MISAIEEPAKKCYFYYKGDWRNDLGVICNETWEENKKTAKEDWDNRKNEFQRIGYELEWWKKAFRVLRGVAFASRAVAVWLGTIVILPIVSVLFAGTVALVWVIYNMIAIEMNWLERLFMKFHGLFILCKHCSRKVPLPVYKCPNCGAEHQRLIPTPKYGAFYRVCSRCGEYIPTSRFWGRNSLPAICPFDDCRQPLNSEDAVPVTIAIIGGRSVGKSFVQMDMTVLMIQKLLPQIGWSHKISSEDEVRISSLVENFNNGIRPASTVDQVAKALCMDVKAPGWTFPKRLYLYDPPGESFKNMEKLAEYNYYQHLRCAIFVIDPFSIDAVAKEFQERLTLDSSTRVSDMSPDESLDRWLNSMEKDHNGISKNTNCAVLINKTDALEFEKVTGLKTGACDKDCRAFLEKYEYGNLIGQIEDNFKKCRFFAISAIGHSQADHFSPEGLEEAIEWVLKSTED